MVRRSRKICAASLDLVRAEGLYCQRMDLGLHQLTECIEYQPVACDPGQARKRRSDDHHPEVAPAIAGAGVPRVQMAFVLDFQQFRA